jgi:hypothetical protein
MVLLKEGIYECSFEMGPGGMIYVPSSMTIGSKHFSNIAVITATI